MSKTETPVSQLKINRLTKTQFDGASDLSDTEIYAVDPEFVGGKVLKTDNNGNIVESSNTYLTSDDIVSSVDSSSTNSKAVGAKLFYDTCGDIEATINAIRGV